MIKLIICEFQRNESPELTCTSIIVGRDATVDGSVLVTHAEELRGDTAQQIQRMVRKNHQPDELWLLKSGREIPHLETEFAFLQYNSNFEYPGVSDAYCAWNPNYLNEWGVITGDNAASERKDLKAELPEAGISSAEIKHAMATRAKTAREAVLLAGELIEKYGFDKTGTDRSRADGIMYLVADADEGWWMEVVTGHHWIAQRCPDDSIMMRANSFRIGEIDFDDAGNFLGSGHLVTNAIEKRWFNPDTDGDFNFSKTYGDPESLRSSNNRLRELMCIKTFSPSHPIKDMSDEYPESMIFTPDKKISKKGLMSFMRTHNEGTRYDSTDGYSLGNPHFTENRTICTSYTVSSSVAQLRCWLPIEIGACLWVAQNSPCTSIYIPWYLGTQNIPQVYENGTDRYDPDSAWWRFKILGMIANMNYKNCSEIIQPVWSKDEKNMFKIQDSIEKVALEIYRKDPEHARSFLTEYCSGLALTAYEKARILTYECIKENAKENK